MKTNKSTKKENDIHAFAQKIYFLANAILLDEENRGVGNAMFMATEIVTKALDVMLAEDVQSADIRVIK